MKEDKKKRSSHDDPHPGRHKKLRIEETQHRSTPSPTNSAKSYSARMFGSDKLSSDLASPSSTTPSTSSTTNPAATPTTIHQPVSERQQFALLKQLGQSSASSHSPSQISTTATTSSTINDSHSNIDNNDDNTSTPGSRKHTKRNSHGETMLIQMAKKGDLSSLRKLVREGADINMCDYAGWSALHECCIRDYPRIANYLLRHGARVNCQGPNGDTPLHDASRNGFEHVVEILLKYGADVNMRNEKQESPLDLATNDNILRLLLKSKAKQASSNDSLNADYFTSAERATTPLSLPPPPPPPPQQSGSNTNSSSSTTTTATTLSTTTTTTSAMTTTPVAPTESPNNQNSPECSTVNVSDSRSHSNNSATSLVNKLRTSPPTTTATTTTVAAITTTTPVAAAPGGGGSVSTSSTTTTISPTSTTAITTTNASPASSTTIVAAAAAATSSSGGIVEREAAAGTSGGTSGGSNTEQTSSLCQQQHSNSRPGTIKKPRESSIKPRSNNDFVCVGKSPILPSSSSSRDPYAFDEDDDDNKEEDSLDSKDKSFSASRNSAASVSNNNNNGNASTTNSSNSSNNKVNNSNLPKVPPLRIRLSASKSDVQESSSNLPSATETQDAPVFGELSSSSTTRNNNSNAQQSEENDNETTPGSTGSAAGGSHHNDSSPKGKSESTTPTTTDTPTTLQDASAMLSLDHDEQKKRKSHEEKEPIRRRKGAVQKEQAEYVPKSASVKASIQAESKRKPGRTLRSHTAAMRQKEEKPKASKAPHPPLKKRRMQNSGSHPRRPYKARQPRANSSAQQQGNNNSSHGDLSCIVDLDVVSDYCLDDSNSVSPIGSAHDDDSNNGGDHHNASSSQDNGNKSGHNVSPGSGNVHITTRSNAACSSANDGSNENTMKGSSTGGGGANHHHHHHHHHHTTGSLSSMSATASSSVINASNKLSRMELPPNPYQKILQQRRKREQSISRLVEVQPKPPFGFEDYLLRTKQYLLVTNNVPQLKKRAVPEDLYSKPELCRLFQEQEEERFLQLVRHQVERDHLRLVAEQEVIRAQSKAALALTRRMRPLSLCSVLTLKDEDVCDSQKGDEENENAEEFSARSVIQWIEDIKTRFDKEKRNILCRQLHEAESLLMVQRLDWELKVKELYIPFYDASPSLLTSWRPQISSDHVPIVEVPRDFPILIHDPLQKTPLV